MLDAHGSCMAMRCAMVKTAIDNHMFRAAWNMGRLLPAFARSDQSLATRVAQHSGRWLRTVVGDTHPVGTRPAHRRTRCGCHSPHVCDNDGVASPTRDSVLAAEWWQSRLRTRRVTPGPPAQCSIKRGRTQAHFRKNFLPDGMLQGPRTMHTREFGSREEFLSSRYL